MRRLALLLLLWKAYGYNPDEDDDAAEDSVVLAGYLGLYDAGGDLDIAVPGHCCCP